MKATYFALVVLALVACAWADDAEGLLPGICTLPMDVGSFCGYAQPSVRVTYNLRIRKCIPFTYNGCDGSANNFDSMAQCQTTCKEDNTNTLAPTIAPAGSTPIVYPTASSPTITAAPTAISPIPSWVPHICLHDINTGVICDDGKPSHRYGFSTTHRQCGSFEYNGCGGNPNNFDTIVECRKTCEMN